MNNFSVRCYAYKFYCTARVKAENKVKPDWKTSAKFTGESLRLQSPTPETIGKALADQI
jgi:hypothetical protein